MMPLADLIELPWLLPLALVLPAAFVWLLRRSRLQRQRRLARLGALDVVRRLVPAVAFNLGRWRAARLALAAALAGLALAGPRWGYERTVVRSTGVDLVLAVDASLSMTATDEKPNRLERVKQEIRRLRALSPGDRVGLLAFAGKSYVLSPITVDEGALDLFLDDLSPNTVGQAGSSLARTIVQGTNLLALTKSGADRALVVMSDGEAFELHDEVAAAAKRAADNNVSLVTVGFGTAAGSTIPVRENGTLTQKRDTAGQVVVTRYSPTLLQIAATAANGTFIPAEATDKAARIKSALSKLRTQARATQTGDKLTPRYQWFLLPAILLLWLDTILGGRHGRRRRAAASAETAVAAGLVAALALGGCAPGRDAADGAAAYKAQDYQRAAAHFKRVAADDKSPGAQYNYGTAMLAMDSTESAAELLEKAAERAEQGDPEIRYRARFNAGLAHLLRGLSAPGDSGSADLKLALAAYKRVLLQRPGDPDAKWNYELALREEKQGGGGGGGRRGFVAIAVGAAAEAAADPGPAPGRAAAGQRRAGGARRAEQEAEAEHAGASAERQGLVSAR